MNEKYLAEEHEMYLPVVQLEHLDLISTLSANPAASTTTIEEFTKHSAGVTESSVEAPSEASSDSYEARTEEPLHATAENREELDEENRVTTVASEKLREGDDFDLQTTTMEPQFKEELKYAQGEEQFFDTEEPPVTQMAELEAKDEEMGELRETTEKSEELAALESTEEPDSSAELRQSDEAETSTTEPPPEDENVSAEMRASEDEELPEPFTSTTTDHSFTSTTAFEGLSTTTSTYDSTTKLATIPDVIVGKNIEEDEPKVTELNAELQVQDASSEADVIFITTTAEPPLVESVETVSIASAEGGDAVGAEIRLEETTGGASNSSELKILQVLYTNNNNNEEPMKAASSSRSADSSDVLFLPQVPRPLMAPAAAVNSHDWKAAAFEETKDELISGLWHEALDI